MERLLQFVSEVCQLAVRPGVKSDGGTPKTPTSAEHNYAVTTALLTVRVPFAEQTSVLGRVGVEGLADNEEPARGGRTKGVFDFGLRHYSWPS